MGRHARRLSAYSPRNLIVHSLVVHGADGEPIAEGTGRPRHLRLIERRPSLRARSSPAPLCLTFSSTVWGDFERLEPIFFEQFLRLVAHAVVSSPGPHGIPHNTWAWCGSAGVTPLYNVYLDILDGQRRPPEFNASVVVFIPKGTTGDARNAAAPQDFRPMALNSTAHKIVPRAMSHTLEQIAQTAVHP